MAELDSHCQYFIAKVNSFPSLKQAIATSKWACANRHSSPQPVDILREAFKQGNVVIIFSVSNCHGWHGYAKMTSAPSVEDLSTSNTSDNKTIGSENNAGDSVPKRNLLDESGKQISTSQMYYYFNIKWLVHFLDFGEQCLLSNQTEELYCSEPLTGNNIQVNKCRNWQKLSCDTGKRLCEMMNCFHKELCLKREQKHLFKVQPQPFLKETADCMTVVETWKKIVHQVENDLGKVILACPFGSQRYNVDTINSDTDMFIIYQGKTKDLLGFNPPKQTVKNLELESCDYTIHEVYRYSELLLSGDARCVETLFLHPSTIVHTSTEFEMLKENKHVFLNRDCLEKYLRDAQGSKGTKYFNKWCMENSDKDLLSPKMCKMIYIIVRLLQNARHLVNDEFVVYRDFDSLDRECLMKIRDGNIPVKYAADLIKELEADITSKKDNVKDNKTEVKSVLENWMLQLRYKDFSESDFET
ncbi:hypothetical protein ACF0H5_016086 [Mactra antiquata]